MMVMVPLTGNTEAVVNATVVMLAVVFCDFLSSSSSSIPASEIRSPICGRYVLKFPFDAIDLVKTEIL